MKIINFAILAGTILLSSCATSIPETTNYNGKPMIMQVKARPGAVWEFYIDGQLIMEKQANVFEGMPVMHGTWKGKPIMVKLQMVSNGWSAMKTADVFIDGQLIETLVVS
jgi:hypothetical protein